MPHSRGVGRWLAPWCAFAESGEAQRIVSLLVTGPDSRLGTKEWQGGIGMRITRRYRAWYVFDSELFRRSPKVNLLMLQIARVDCVGSVVSLWQ